MIRQQMKFGEWLMLVTLSLVWGGSFFFNGVAVAELPVLTIVLCRHGAVCFHEMGGSCDAGGPPDLTGLFLDGVSEQCHPLRPNRLGAGLFNVRLCVDHQRTDAPLRGSCGAFCH